MRIRSGRAPFPDALAHDAKSCLSVRCFSAGLHRSQPGYAPAEAQVDLSIPGQVRLKDAKSEAGPDLAVSYDRARFSVTAEEIPLTDARLSAVWGKRLARIQLTSLGASVQGEHRIVVRYAQ